MDALNFSWMYNFQVALIVKNMDNLSFVGYSCFKEEDCPFQNEPLGAF